MVELTEQIKVVATARSMAQTLYDAKAKAYAKWEKENEETLNGVTKLRERVQKEEDKLRELTLQAYIETGNKAPAPGVGIREHTVLTYDGKIAFDWAKSHKMALKLDVKAFEKIAKADTPDFVKISTEATATIATNLEG